MAGKYGYPTREELVERGFVSAGTDKIIEYMVKYNERDKEIIYFQLVNGEAVNFAQSVTVDKINAFNRAIDVLGLGGEANAESK